MSLGKFAKKVLDSLPFDESKTKLGGWGILGGLGGDILGFPLPVDPQTALVTGVLTFGIGLLHKWLKKKYPEVKWPKQGPDYSS